MMKFVCSIFGIPFHYGNNGDIYQFVQHAIEQKKECYLIYTPNPEILMVSLKDEPYRHILQEADVSLPDGNGLLFASTFLHKTQAAGTIKTIWYFILCYTALLFHKSYLRESIPAVIPGSDTFFSLHPLLQEKQYSVFYFGGEGGVEHTISGAMRERYPHLRVVGATGGYPFKNPEESERILQEIESAKPDIVFVALSFPWQERWAHMHKKRLQNAGVSIVMVVGGTFDFAVGKRKRAPQIFQKLQIEWLWRLAIEPRRMGRIMTAVVFFPLFLLRKRLRGERDLFSLVPPLGSLHK